MLAAVQSSKIWNIESRQHITCRTCHTSVDVSGCQCFYRLPQELNGNWCLERHIHLWTHPWVIIVWPTLPSETVPQYETSKATQQQPHACTYIHNHISNYLFPSNLQANLLLHHRKNPPPQRIRPKRTLRNPEITGLVWSVIISISLVERSAKIVKRPD